MKDSELEDLLKRFISSDLDAFSQLVDQFQPTLMNFLLSMGVSYSDVDDLAQEVWIKIYDYRKRYEPKAKFTTFMYTIAKQKVIDLHRHRERRRGWLTVFFEVKNHREEQRLRVQWHSEDHQIPIETYLKELSQEHREVLVLRMYEKMSYQEMSELLGVALGTVKSRLHTALRQLKHKMKGEA